jgi:hypothetical protein
MAPASDALRIQAGGLDEGRPGKASGCGKTSRDLLRARFPGGDHHGVVALRHLPAAILATSSSTRYRPDVQDLLARSKAPRKYTAELRALLAEQVLRVFLVLQADRLHDVFLRIEIVGSFYDPGFLQCAGVLHGQLKH